MNELLHFKYSPSNLNDYELQDETKDIFDMFIVQNKLNIILYGKSYSGKTNIATSLMNEYYKGISKLEINNNVLIINQLKEQGINYYKNEVNIFCQIKSVIRGKKKLIIIDDMDLINDQCQQIFRIFLEKYNSNIMFITTCSNLQKINQSFKNRLFIIELLVPSIKYVENKIDEIIKGENLNITNDAIQFIVKNSNNNIKRVLNYMEKIKLLNDEITMNVIMNISTNNNYYKFSEYTKCLTSKNLSEAINKIITLYYTGYSVIDILESYYLYIKITDDINEEIKYNIIQIICQYITIFYIRHENYIELILFTNKLFQLF